MHGFMDKLECEGETDGIQTGTDRPKLPHDSAVRTRSPEGEPRGGDQDHDKPAAAGQSGCDASDAKEGEGRMAAPVAVLCTLVSTPPPYLHGLAGISRIIQRLSVP